MDIIDILIARAKSFPGETAALVKAAQSAMAKANAVADKAEDIQELLEDAEAANTRAEEIASNLEGMQSDIDTAIDTALDEKLTDISKIEFSTNNTNSYHSNVATVDNVPVTIDKNYTSTGNNEDGGMTQKAITDSLNTINTRIDNLPTSGSGSSNISVQGANGAVIVANGEGGIRASNLNEDELIEMQIAGGYTVSGVVGVEIDYNNRTVTRVQESAGMTAGADFNKFNMFGGRRRVVIANNGTITPITSTASSWFDGSQGQVMVEQPPFYYLRKPIETISSQKGTIINKELLLLSDNNLPGFTLHPAFNGANKPIYFSAFEGCAKRANGNYVLDDAQDVDFTADKLVSIAGAKPISGSSQNLTVANAVSMAARNVGDFDWDILDLQTESVNQMLMIVEFGSLNIQSAFNKGIVNIPRYEGQNCACITGATISLGNNSGMATTTTQIVGATTNTFTNEEGKCAISYRGMENPYGNIWHLCHETISAGGTGKLNETISLPDDSGWISNFQYLSDSDYNCAFIPILTNGSSSLPIGDYCYITKNLNTNNTLVMGGSGISGDNAGLFYYGFDVNQDTHNPNYGARLVCKRR